MTPCACFCREALSPFLPPGLIRSPAQPSLRLWQLCALAPEAADRLAGTPLRGRTLLVPYRAYCPLWQAAQVVSYGLSPRCTLTLSSMGPGAMLCVQRSFADRLGRTVEEQELPLPGPWASLPDRERLLLAGVWLLCGGLEGI